jgi:hypothetical protein
MRTSLLLDRLELVLWQIKEVEAAACAWLPGHDSSGLGKDYGPDLSHGAPICPKDASGNFARAFS